MGSKSRMANKINGHVRAHMTRCEVPGCKAHVPMSQTQIVHLLGDGVRIRACIGHAQPGAAPAIHAPRGRRRALKHRRNGRLKP